MSFRSMAGAFSSYGLGGGFLPFRPLGRFLGIDSHLLTRYWGQISQRNFVYGSSATTDSV